MARGPGGVSLRQTAAWASMLGIADLSNPGVKYRLDQATGFLAAVVEHPLAAKVPGADLRWPGRILRAADGTCISKPGSTGTDWRVHGVFDVGRGGFSPPTGPFGRTILPLEDALRFIASVDILWALI